MFTETLQNYLVQIELTLPKYLFGILAFALFYILATFISKIFKKRLQKKLSDPILAQLMSRIIHWTLIIFGLAIAMRIAGLSGIATSLLAGAGVSAFVIGFAFKDIAENFLAGIILAFNRPFNINETIKTGAITGRVVELDLRNIRLKTFDGKDVYIPNALILKEPLFNNSRDSILRHEFLISIDYKEDIEKANKVIIKAISDIEEVVKSKKTFVSVENFSSIGIKLKIHFWFDVKNEYVKASDLKLIVQSDVKNALMQNNIKIAQSIIEDSPSI